MKTLRELFDTTAELSQKRAKEILGEHNHDGDAAFVQGQLDLSIDILREVFAVIDAAEPRLRAFNISPLTVLASVIGVSPSMALAYGNLAAQETFARKLTVDDARRVGCDLHSIQLFTVFQNEEVGPDSRMAFAVAHMLKTAIASQEGK